MALAIIKIADVDKKISSLKILKQKLTDLKKLCEEKRNGDSCPALDILDKY